MGILLLPAGRLAAPGLPAAGEVAFYVVSAPVRAPSVRNTHPGSLSACGALSLMLDRYLACADTGRPVHTWPSGRIVER